MPVNAAERKKTQLCVLCGDDSVLVHEEGVQLAETANQTGANRIQNDFAAIYIVINFIKRILVRHVCNDCADMYAMWARSGELKKLRGYE